MDDDIILLLIGEGVDILDEFGNKTPKRIT